MGGAASVARLRVEHLTDTLGVGVSHPRLSWIVDADETAWRQAAYEIEAQTTGRVARTGVVAGQDSVLVPWPFAPLTSRARASVRVRAWSDDGRLTRWSGPVTIEAGLLDAADWSARFISPMGAHGDAGPQPCPLLRREFSLEGEIVSARLYATALGVYDAQLNGAGVGDHVLAPGWTSYDHRLRYQTYDVTALVREGPNVLSAVLGDGWFRGRLGWDGGRRNVWGDRVALLAQLEITYVDGTTQRVVTDHRWRTAPGPTLAADLYDGEHHDARREPLGWMIHGYDDADWSEAVEVRRDLRTLVAPTGPPVRRIELRSPKAILTSPSGRTIVDFGQNLVGRLRLTVKGHAGDTVVIRHAEVLDDGELCTGPLRDARATDTYVCRGDATETWEPRFTFHGFRYAEIRGWPGTLTTSDVAAVVCHSDLERTGWFSCSDPDLEQLHTNILWGMRGNFLDVPTDCPQRDERLGWTGDLQVFAPTAAFLFDVCGLLTSWLADLAADQHVDGGVPLVVPDALSVTMPEIDEPRAVWSDAAVIVPWVLYQRFGDAGILAAQWDSMRRWVDYVAACSDTPLWDDRFQYGDWLDPAAPDDAPWAGSTPARLVADAYFAYSAQLVADAAAVLRHDDEQRRYAARADEVRAAFDARYVRPSGAIPEGGQTAYALVLAFALLEDIERRRTAGRALVALVREADHRISTGFVGTALVCDALCAAGAQDTAYRLLLQRQCPSWLYPVTTGATTMWERWDGVRPDGSIHPSGMISYNHYAFGAVADWLHRSAAGLAPAEPGYRRIQVQPQPGPGLTYARARHLTPYGPAEAGWSRDGDTVTVDALVPANATGTVVLPGTDGQTLEVGPGRHRWTCQVPRDTPDV